MRCLIFGVGTVFFSVFLLSSVALAQSVSAESEGQRAARERIEKVLDGVSEAKFDKAPLLRVAEELEKKCKIPIHLDKTALQDWGMSNDFSVTASFWGSSLRAILNRILQPHELTFIIKNEALYITTEEKAESELFIRVYAVQDLVPAPDELYGEPTTRGYQPLIDAIQNGVARPEDWADVGGGDGTIEALSNLGVLSVRQSYKIHRELTFFLDALRKARKTPSSHQVGQQTRPQANPAEAKQQVRVYFLKRPPLVAAKEQMASNASSDALPKAAEVTPLITEIVSPSSWRQAGGDSLVKGVGYTLVVKAQPALQKQVGLFLRKTSLLEITPFGLPHGSGFGGGGFGGGGGMFNLQKR